MPDLIVNRRGYFWRGDLPVPEGQFAPDDCINGALTIDSNGSIELSLNGVMQVSDEKQRLPQHPLPPDFVVAGILFETNERIRLYDVMPNGGHWSTNGPRSENLSPLMCLVGTPGPALDVNPLQIKSFSFPLAGYEDWLRLGNVVTQTTETGFTLSYSRPKNLAYQLSDGALEIIFDCDVERSGFRYSPPRLEEYVYLKYAPIVACSVNRAAEISRFFDDLFLLLTNIDDHLQWPEINASNDQRFKLYYYRVPQARKSDSPHLDLWTTFPSIKEQLGSLVDEWLKKREELGAAFYMYTGTRRASSIYSEHKFMSFVQGLESLHRQTTVADNNLDERIGRILAQVQDSKDKRWLKGLLKNAHEPRLEQRSFEVLSKLPIAFLEKELRQFTKRCADRRNDISHFAGTRSGAQQREFYDELQLLTQPLDYLYHAVILQEIGLSEEVLRHVFLKSWSTFLIKDCLKRAGLSVPSD